MEYNGIELPEGIRVQPGEELLLNGMGPLPAQPFAWKPVVSGSAILIQPTPQEESDGGTQPVGEYPDVTVAQAYEALDDVFEELADLKAENLLLRAQLVEARDELAIARVLHNRRGW